METNRIGYWDNVKGILIFLVVLAHYYGTGMVYGTEHTGALLVPVSIYTFIYLFHMPLFAFISGYFSKNTEKCRRQAFSQLLLPYLVVNTICVLLDRETVNPLFSPYGPMWYPLALFLWRMVAKDVGKLKYSWLWALAFALISSVLMPGKNYVSLNDAITFFPCFMLGLETGPETIQKIRKLPHWLCIGVLICAMACSAIVLGPLHQSFLNVCFFCRNYVLAPESLIYLGVDILRYGVAAVMSVCVLNLVPSRTSFLTRLGKNTLTIMFLHSIPHLRDGLYALNPLPHNIPFSMVWWTLWSLLATVLLGSPPVAHAFHRVMDWLRRILPKKAPAVSE